MPGEIRTNSVDAAQASAMERLRNKPRLNTEKARAEFVDDFQEFLKSGHASDKDKKAYKQVFDEQDRVSKLYIGQIVIEQLGNKIKNSRDEETIKNYLDIAKLLDLPKNASLNKDDQKALEELFKKLRAIYFIEDPSKSKDFGRRGFLKVVGGAAATAGLGWAGYDWLKKQPKSMGSEKIAVTTPKPEIAVSKKTPAPAQIIPSVAKDPVLQKQLEPTPTPEKLIPNPIRMLQNETLNKLWSLGALTLKETIIAGKKIVLLDYNPAYTGAEAKFGAIYKSNPLSGRVVPYSVNGETRAYIKQALSMCATHSFVNAAEFLGDFKDEQGRPVVINPLLLAEASDLSPDEYKQYVDEILGKSPDKKTFEVYKKVYPDVALAAITGALNLGLQVPGRFEKVLKSVFGIELKRILSLRFPDEKDPKNIRMPKELFSEGTFNETAQKLGIDTSKGDFYTNPDNAGKIYGSYLEDWYKNLVSSNIKEGQKATALFSLRFDESNINHLFTVLGVRSEGGRNYFHMVEPRGAQFTENQYLRRNGLRPLPDGTCLVPLDQIWKIGIFGVYTATTEKPAVKIEQPKAPERRESLMRSELFGFRVNSVEAIDKLPAGVGTIRIAGNETALNPDGTIKDQEGVYFFEKMLNAADKKGLKVVFVYNPKRAPGRETIEKQMRAIINHPSVLHVEVGNEIDENSPNCRVRFWEGSMADYAKFFKSVSEEVAKINIATGRNTELIISSFSDPSGKRNHSEKNYADLIKALKENGVDTSKYYIAGHAYSLDDLDWIIKNLRNKTGAKGIMVTEINVGRGNEPTSQREFSDMINYLSRSGIKALIHEWKPEMPDDIDYTQAHYALDKNDPRTLIVMSSIDKELKQRQGIAHASIVPPHI